MNKTTIKINKITTKMGDNGESLGNNFGNCTMMKKSHIWFELIGNLDELNSWIGIIVNDSSVNLEFIQHTLFDIGSALYTNKPFEPNITKIEEIINLHTIDLTSFVLPNNYFHIARALCRKTERSFWNVCYDNKFEKIGAYLNRLSDLLFVLALENTNLTLWEPKVHSVLTNQKQSNPSESCSESDSEQYLQDQSIKNNQSKEIE